MMLLALVSVAQLRGLRFEYLMQLSALIGCRRLRDTADGTEYFFTEGFFAKVPSKSEVAIIPHEHVLLRNGKSPYFVLNHFPRSIPY